MDLAHLAEWVQYLQSRIYKPNKEFKFQLKVIQIANKEGDIPKVGTQLSITCAPSLTAFYSPVQKLPVLHQPGYAP